MIRSALRLRAQPGHRDDLLRLFRELGILAAASEQPGFLNCQVHVPVDDEAELLVLAAWTRPEAYEGWLASPVRGAMAKQLERLLEGEPESRVYVVVEER